MLVLNINTGHQVEHDLSIIQPTPLAALVPMARSGGKLGSIRIEIDREPGHAVFTLFKRRVPLVTCGLAWTEPGAMEMWAAMEDLFLPLADWMELRCRPRRPASIPWLAVLLLPAYVPLPWLDDFAVCLAAAVLMDRE